MGAEREARDVAERRTRGVAERRTREAEKQGASAK